MSRAFDISVKRHPNYRLEVPSDRFFPKLRHGESAFDLERALSCARMELLQTGASSEDKAHSLAFANLVAALHWIDGTRKTRAALHPANYISAASALLRLLGRDATGELRVATSRLVHAA